MDWRAIVLTAIVLALALSRFVLGVALFAAPLPLRKGAHLRIPIALCALYVLYCALTGILLGTTAERGGSAFAIAQFVLFSLLLIALVGATLLVFDTNPLTALFCCSSGYTVQNFASGATELIWSLMPGQRALGAHRRLEDARRTLDHLEEYDITFTMEDGEVKIVSLEQL
jgi:hypothetical protein